MQCSDLSRSSLSDCGLSPCTSLPAQLVAACSLAVLCSGNGKCVQAGTLSSYTEFAAVP